MMSARNEKGGEQNVLLSSVISGFREKVGPNGGVCLHLVKDKEFLQVDVDHLRHHLCLSPFMLVLCNSCWTVQQWEAHLVSVLLGKDPLEK